MNAASRTNKSIQNGKIAMLYYVANMLLGFYSRKVFIDYVGIEVLGLNQTAQNLLGFLNLAELGIGSAIAFTLYKPIAHNDENSINEIISVQGWLYRRIAIIIGLGAIVLMAFFPLIFKDISLPLWYAYASFGVFLYSSLLTYFVNYKQILLSASQLEYKIIYSYNFVILIKSAIQILCMIYLPYPYVWWLLLQIVFSTIASYNLNYHIQKIFPFLKTAIGDGKRLAKKYSVITTKIKQLFFHAVGGFVLTQMSSLLIFAFVDLKMVAIYGNYMLIANCLRMLFNSVFTGITAGIGNLQTEENNEKSLRIFKEIFSVKFLLITTILFTFYEFSNPFMGIWIGKELILSKSTLLIIVLTLYIILSRTTVDSYIYAKGMFQDIWAPIIEAILNIGLSILLGYYFGINGVLFGALISLIIVVFLWKPYFLFKKGLNMSLAIYVKLNVVHFVSFGLTAFVTLLILKPMLSNAPTTYIACFFQALIFAVVNILLLGLLLLLTSIGMRDFYKRVKFIIRSR